MADNSMLIKVGLIGGAAYLAYRQGWLSFLGIGTAATATGGGGTGGSGTGGGTAGATGSTAPTYPPLATIFNQMSALAQSDWNASHSSCDNRVGAPIGPVGSMVQSPPVAGRRNPTTGGMAALMCRQTPAMFSMDDWNAYAVRAGGPNPMPDPMQAFPGSDRAALMTAQQYWSGMVPLLAKQGLSGYIRFGRAA